MRNKIVAVWAFALFILLPVCPGFAQKTTLALLGITNTGGDPRQEYLAGIIQGVLLFDLSSRPEIAVVDRTHLEDVLREQELQLGAVIGNQGKALEIGKILGADFLVRMDYIFLGREVQVNASLTEVATAGTVTFSDRGTTENLIHGLSERIVLKLTGKAVAFRSPQRDFSILSLTDEKPGSIALYPGLIDAEIFLDGEFAGYSGRDTRVPFVMESVRPGPHGLRIRLSRFGVVSLPDFTLKDWEQVVEVKPGERATVRATAAHFNDIVVRSMKLVDEEIPFSKLTAGVSRAHDLSFTNTEGKRVAATLEISITSGAASIRLEGTLTVDGTKRPFSIESKTEDAEATVEAGEIELSLQIDRGWKSVSYEAVRTDIWQNMDIGEER
jgi:TolB-like protein